MAKLKVVDTKPGGPPRPLGECGMGLWRRIMDEYEIDDAGGLELLCLACQALDRAESCRGQIDEAGEVSTVNGQPGRPHPLLRDEIANRAFVVKTLERLGIASEPAKAAGRPPGTWNYAKAKNAS